MSFVNPKIKTIDSGTVSQINLPQTARRRTSCTRNICSNYAFINQVNIKQCRSIMDVNLHVLQSCARNIFTYLNNPKTAPPLVLDMKAVYGAIKNYQDACVQLKSVYGEYVKKKPGQTFSRCTYAVVSITLPAIIAMAICKLLFNNYFKQHLILSIVIYAIIAVMALIFLATVALRCFYFIYKKKIVNQAKIDEREMTHFELYRRFIEDCDKSSLVYNSDGTAQLRADAIGATMKKALKKMRIYVEMLQNLDD